MATLRKGSVASRIPFLSFAHRYQRQKTLISILFLVTPLALLLVFTYNGLSQGAVR